MKSLRIAPCLLAAAAVVTVLALPSAASADVPKPRRQTAAKQGPRKPKPRTAPSAAAEPADLEPQEKPRTTSDRAVVAHEPEQPKQQDVKPSSLAGPPAVDRDEGASQESTPRRIALGGLLGYASNHLNLGIGARGGYTLPNQIYLGGTFLYQLGSSDDVPGVGKIGASALYGGFEGGYDLHAGPVMIRPFAGVGPAVAFVSGPGESDSKASLGFWFGAAADYTIPKSPAFVGADSRLLVTTGGGDVSIGFFLGGGVRL